MRVVVDAAEAARVDVAVDLGRRERGVPQELLDRAEVGAALEEMGRVCVAEPVRMGDEAAQHARVQPAPAGREEQCVAGAGREVRAAIAQVPRNLERRDLAEGTTRSLSPLPRTRRASCSKSTSPRSRSTASALRSPHE